MPGENPASHLEPREALRRQPSLEEIGPCTTDEIEQVGPNR